MTTAIFSNIHDYGVYYRGPIGAIKEAYQNEFRENFDLEMDDMDSLVSAEYDCFEDYSDVEFDYMDHFMWKDLKNEIFRNKYEHYLEYTTCGNWRGQAGYRFRTLKNALEYNYDCSMDYLARSKSYKYFHFRMHSHDVQGASHYYIGLNDRERTFLENAAFDDVIDWIEEKLETIDWIEKW